MVIEDKRRRKELIDIIQWWGLSPMSMESVVCHNPVPGGTYMKKDDRLTRFRFAQARLFTGLPGHATNPCLICMFAR